MLLNWYESRFDVHKAKSATSVIQRDGVVRVDGRCAEISPIPIKTLYLLIRIPDKHPGEEGKVLKNRVQLLFNALKIDVAGVTRGPIA